VNFIARNELVRELELLKQHGTSMSMLVITVRNTSNGLLAGNNRGEFSLDYPVAGWLDFMRIRSFRSFCSQRGFRAQKVRWGNEYVIRATIGISAEQAADVIDACFSAVYGESGAFGLELRGFGWQASNNGLESGVV
jgi:hypothetical protein